MNWMPAIATILLWGPAAGAEIAPPLDTVIVEGRQSELDDLRQVVVELEDRFYERYNLINTVPDFAVHCAREARVGTLMRRRTCRAVYEDRAMQDEGTQAFQFRQFIQEQFTSAAGLPNPEIITMGGPPVQAAVMIEMRRPAFRKNMLDVARGDRQLQQLLREKHDAELRYDEARRRLFGLRSVEPEAATDR